MRDARDRLNQTLQNSSRPSGSYAPWKQVANAERERQTDDSVDDAAEDSTEKQALKPEATQEATRTADNQESAVPANQPGKNKRKRGKQPGAKGVGQEVRLAVTGEVIHKATECTCCRENFAETASFQATTARYMLNIERTERGIEVSPVKHIYGEQCCGCGHVTQRKPGRCGDKQGVERRIDRMAFSRTAVSVADDPPVVAHAFVAVTHPRIFV